MKTRIIVSSSYEYREFELQRRSLIEIAVRIGVRLAQRPAGVKADEGNVTLYPDMHGDLRTGLMVGQQVKPISWVRAVPWGFETYEEEVKAVKCFPDHSTEETFILCFANVPFIGKCRVEGTLAILARLTHNALGLHEFLIDRSPESKPLLYPLDYLEAVLD